MVATPMVTLLSSQHIEAGMGITTILAAFVIAVVPLIGLFHSVLWNGQIALTGQ